MITKTIVNGKLATNSYLVYCDKTRQAVVIDPAEGVLQIIEEIKELGLSLQLIINTHAHADHISGNKKILTEFNCQLAIGERDAAMLHNADDNFASYLGMDREQPAANILLKEGDTIKIGENEVVIIDTPGHTEGGISLYLKDENILFSGDTLFRESMGRVDLPGGDIKKIIKSLQKLCQLPNNTIVYPGHGRSSTIEHEKEHNPYCL